jgi:hypothetical protein
MEVQRRPLVFTEWHHGGLFHAMGMMFEGRLGGTLVGPTGYEWATEGIWKLSKLPDTIKQYLNPELCVEGPDGFKYYYDKGEDYVQKRMTLEEFKNTKFDIILCTLQEHEYTFHELQQRFQPQAKFIRLCGNVGEQVNWDNFNNFIDTTKLYQPPATCNTVVIHQEFPMESFFYTEPANHQRISNFMNNLPQADALGIWQAMRSQLLDYTFKMHGSNGEDGMIDGLPQLAQAMRDSAFIFMVKHQGEGYGHVIHNAYAVGRPVIVQKEFYIGKLAERFLIDDYSCITIDDKDWPTLIKKIRYWSIPENHKRMCKNAHDLFVKYVKFDEDEKKFRKFIDNLK